MNGINTASYTPTNLYAGDFPIAKDVGAIKSGATIHQYAPIVLGDDGIEELKADMLPTEEAEGMLDKLIGIAAAESSEDTIVYYLTGEFFAQSLYMPNGVSASDIKLPLRKLGIFLKGDENSDE